MRAAPAWLRLALRELRGGLRGFYVFVACIALGVAAIAGVNSVGRALEDGLSSQGRTILGGDLSFSIVHREASLEELAFFRAKGAVGTVASLRAMVRRSDEQNQAVVELKAVDPTYPHGGNLALEGGDGDGALLARQADGIYGAYIARDLAARLGVASGEMLKLGETTLRIDGVIASEPDRLSAGIGFGPRMLISIDALRATGLLRPGSLVTWTYRLRLPDAASDLPAAARVKSEADRLFPQAGWTARTRDDAAPSLRRNIEQFSAFLTLVGLTALVVGGVGVANAVASFIELKRPAIATLKCLGATNATIFRVYLTQILLLAAFGIAVGLVVGSALPFIAKAALAELVPVSKVGIYPLQLALAVLYGLLVTLGFALGPLGRAQALRASGLFADRAVHAPVRIPLGYRAAQAAALLALAALAVLLAGDEQLSLTLIAGVIVTFTVLRLVALAIMAIASRVRSVRGASLRLAVRNLHRPGALTPSVVLSLGLGLTLLVSIALVDANLRQQFTGSIAEKAPDFFFVDVQRDEREAFLQVIEEAAPGGALETVPMLRGRISAVDGVPAARLAEKDGASWALRGDRGLTYSETLPPNSSIIAGEWWPKAYSGEPLVSLEQGVAKDLGLSVGDTIGVNVLGRDITARIANLRSLDWESLSINFVMVFSPNTLRDAPHSYLATLRLPPDGRSSDAPLLKAVTAAFPGVTSISVRDAIASVNQIVAQLTRAVRVAASLALLISMLVLGGALAAGHRQRRQDAVILKTLGATRPVLLSAFSLEYGLLGLATALFAIAAGTTAAWYVVTRVMEFDFVVYPGVAATAAATALAVTLGLGLSGTWRILSIKPASLLKNL